VIQAVIYLQHPSICEFPSNQFYNGELQAADEVMTRQWQGQLPTNLWPQPQKQRSVFIHVEGTEEISGIDAKGSYEESKYNKEEAKIVVSYQIFIKALNYFSIPNRNML